MARVATAGEALVDLIGGAGRSYEACPGGAIFNLTRAIARQGEPVSYLNPLSNDRFGRQLAAALKAESVLLAQAEPLALPTAIAVVDIDPSGHPGYAFYRQGVADRAVTADALNAACAALPRVEVVCTGCLALAAEDADRYLPWLVRQRLLGRSVVVDANLRPAAMPDLPGYRANVLRALELADLIKASDEDLAMLAVPGEDPFSQALWLLAHTPAAAVVLTLGARGACLLPRSGALCHVREAAPVAVVDSVGAGDSFLAGLLVALLQEGAMPRALRALTEPAAARRAMAHALASASLCVLQRGAYAPTRAEVVRRLGDHPCVFA